MTIDLASTVQICVPDLASTTVDGTSFALPLHSDKPGAWTLDSLTANPSEGLTITKSWLLNDPDPQAVFGNGFPVPPTKDNPEQVELWKDRQPLPGAKLEGDPAKSVVLLQLNRTATGEGKFTGLVLNYTDATGPHTQTAAGFNIRLSPPGIPCEG